MRLCNENGGGNLNCLYIKLSCSLGCDKIVVEAELRLNKSLARMVARRQHDSDEEDEDEVCCVRNLMDQILKALNT